MSFHEQGNAVPIAIIGLMTASRRLRMAGGILGMLLLAVGSLLWLAFRGDPDPTSRAGGILVMLLGGGFIFYWVVASVMSWFIRITREDVQRES